MTEFGIMIDHQEKWDIHILMINQDAKFRHILPIRRTAGLEF